MILGWGGAMLVTAAAPSFLWLLCFRAALGLLSAAAYPAVMSLIGTGSRQPNAVGYWIWSWPVNWPAPVSVSA